MHSGRVQNLKAFFSPSLGNFKASYQVHNILRASLTSDQNWQEYRKEVEIDLNCNHTNLINNEWNDFV